MANPTDLSAIPPQAETPLGQPANSALASPEQRAEFEASNAATPAEGAQILKSVTTEPDPATQATDILDAERKGLNDPEDATPEHGDTTPGEGADTLAEDDFDPDFAEEEDDGEDDGVEGNDLFENDPEADDSDLPPHTDLLNE